MNSKKYSLTWEQMEEENKTGLDLAQMVLNDPELPNLDEVIIGYFTPGYDSNVCAILDAFIEHRDKLSHITSFFFGDMDSEECEVSWIEQGSYEAFLKAFPNIKSLKIKGANELDFGAMEHEGLENLEIICGGLPKAVLHSLGKSRLPKLKSLMLYLGEENYGFDGQASDVLPLLSKERFPSLTRLGLMNFEEQDTMVPLVFQGDILPQLEYLCLGYGVLTDKGGQVLLDNAAALGHLKTLDLTYHYLSEAMVTKLKALPIPVLCEDAQKPDEYDGELYYMQFIGE